MEKVAIELRGTKVVVEITLADHYAAMATYDLMCAELRVANRLTLEITTTADTAERKGEGQ